MIRRWMSDDLLAGVQALTPIADGLGLSMAQLSLAWVLQNANVSAAIIGASRPEQVAENAKAVGVQLPEHVLDAIDEALGGVPNRDAAAVARSTPSERPA